MTNKVTTCKAMLSILKQLLKPSLLAASFFWAAIASASLTAEQAEQIVQNTNCNGQTIAEAIKSHIKRHSQRDLGWRVFIEEDYIDVERAILVNKGRQIRYRWRIDRQGLVAPVNKKARQLCAGS